MELTAEGLEEFEYVMKNNGNFPTYKCPYKENKCYLYGKREEFRYRNRYYCLKCKGFLLNDLVHKM